MNAIIDLAPGADENPLAVRLAELVRDNLAKHPRRIRDFRAIRGAVQIVADDTGDALTMRFDLGRLTIHGGSIGIPAVTICGSTAALLSLPDLPMTPLAPLLRRTEGASLMGLVAGGGLTIYGLASHPRLLLRLRRLIAR